MFTNSLLHAVLHTYDPTAVEPATRPADAAKREGGGGGDGDGAAALAALQRTFDVAKGHFGCPPLLDALDVAGVEG